MWQLSYCCRVLTLDHPEHQNRRILMSSLFMGRNQRFCDQKNFPDSSLIKSPLLGLIYYESQNSPFIPAAPLV